MAASIADRVALPPTSASIARRYGYVYYVRDQFGALLETSRSFPTKPEATQRAASRKIAIAYLALRVAALAGWTVTVASDATIETAYCALCREAIANGDIVLSPAVVPVPTSPLTTCSACGERRPRRNKVHRDVRVTSSATGLQP